MVITFICSLSSCSMTGKNKNYRELVGQWYAYKANWAGQMIEGHEPSAVSWPNYQKAYFELSETDKIYFLMFWLGIHKPETMDGELSILTIMMIGGGSNQGDYDRNIVINRLKTIKSIPRSRMNSFAKNLSVNPNWILGNVNEFSERITNE